MPNTFFQRGRKIFQGLRPASLLVTDLRGSRDASVRPYLRCLVPAPQLTTTAILTIHVSMLVCYAYVFNSRLSFFYKSMDWTSEDNMVDGLFFCVTLTGRRGGHTPFVQAGAETSNNCEEAAKPNPGSSWEALSDGGGCRCRGWKCGFLWDYPPTPHSIGDPPSAPHIRCCCQMNWWDVVRRVQMGVSIWGAVHLHSMDGWALSGGDVQAPWHDTLEAVWLHCNEAQQVGCPRGLEGCLLVKDTGIQSQFARRSWWPSRWGGYEHRIAVLCGWMDQG